MKHIRISLLLIIFLMVCSVVFAEPDKNNRMLWLWSVSDNIIDDYFAKDNDTLREEFLSFCAAPHGDPSKKITTLFLGCFDTVTYNPAKVYRFLADMNRRGFTIYYTMGTPLWALPKPDSEVPLGLDNDGFYSNKYFREAVYKEYFNNGNLIRKTGIISFLKNTDDPYERFAGIMLDIEPYQLGFPPLSEVTYMWDIDDTGKSWELPPDNPQGKTFPVIWKTYMDCLSYCKDSIDDYNSEYDPDIDFSDAMVYWYKDKVWQKRGRYVDGDDDNEGVLVEDVMEQVDFSTVMAYRDCAYNKTLYIYFSSPTGHGPDFGIEQDNDAMFDPPLDCSNAVVFVDVKTNFQDTVNYVVTAEMIDNEGKKARLPNNSLNPLPSENDGWDTLTFNSQYLTEYDNGSIDLSSITKINILFTQAQTDLDINDGLIIIDSLRVKNYNTSPTTIMFTEDFDVLDNDSDPNTSTQLDWSVFGTEVTDKRILIDNETDNGIVYWIEDLIAESTGSKKCVVTVETTFNTEDPYSIPETTTFYNEGYDFLEQELAKILSKFQGDSGFGGISIHSYADISTPNRAYQNFNKSPGIPGNTNKAPVVTVTSPLGAKISGINLTTEAIISWDVYNPDDKNYNISVSYMQENDGDFDNDSSWTPIIQYTDISSETQNGSYTWGTQSITTTSSNRAFVKVKISYYDNDSLTSFDTIDYGLAINENPVFVDGVWSDHQEISFLKAPLALQIIPENDGVMHAAYYVFWGEQIGDDFTSNGTGIFYKRSTNWGQSWETILNLAPGKKNGVFLGSFPRKPAFAKNGNHIGIAWVENIDAIAHNTVNDKDLELHICFSRDNGVTWDNDTFITVSDSINFPNLFFDNDGEAHLMWESEYTSISSIKYMHFYENDGTWENDGIELVHETDNDDYVFKTPSLCKTSNGLHVVWGEYQKPIYSITQGTTTVFEDFESYDENINFNLTSSAYSAWGQEHSNQKIIEEESNKFLRLYFYSATGKNKAFPTTMTQKNTHRFDPVMDFTGATIEFDVKTNFTTGFDHTISVVLDIDVAGSPDTPYKVRTKDLRLANLPASSPDWTHLVFYAEDCILQVEYRRWFIPDFTKVKECEIYVTQLGKNSDDIVGGTYPDPELMLDIDNFKVIQANSITTATNPKMRILSKTKSPTETWEDIEDNDSLVKEIFSHEYDNDQRSTKGVDELPDYQPYFPKLISAPDNDDLYVVWQTTTKGIPPDTGLDQYSDTYFAKSDDGTNWNNECLTDADCDTINGFNPAISAWDNDGNQVLQVVYSNDFYEYGNDSDIFTGNLILRETTDNGATWDPSDYIVTSRDNENVVTGYGIRRPTIKLMKRAFQLGAYPYTYTISSGDISIISWVNGKDEEKYIIRGFPLIDGTPIYIAPPPVFVEPSAEHALSIKWKAPELGYIPNGYYLSKIKYYKGSKITYDNITLLNNGDPIYNLSYIDNEGITDNDGKNYYRYFIKALISDDLDKETSWSEGSNVVQDDSQLLAHDFIRDSDNNIYSAIVPTIGGNTSYILEHGFVTDNEGKPAYKIVYENTTGSYQSGARVEIHFPTIMDLSNYGSIEVKVKVEDFTPYPNAEIEFAINFVEKPINADTGSDSYRIGRLLPTVEDGKWHHLHQFMDDHTLISETRGTLDLDNIEKMTISCWGRGKLTAYIGNISFSKDLILELDIAGDIYNNIENNGMAEGKVINPTNPVSVEFGNAQDPWYLRIYTEEHIYDNEGNMLDNEGNPANENDGTAVKLTKHGLIRMDKDNDGNITAIYPQYNLPIKMWCKPFGPYRFFDSDGDSVYEDNDGNAYPPINDDNVYFWKGYDFNQDGDKYDEIYYSSENLGIFIEGTDAGEYSFDIDGDGFQEDDDYFSSGDETHVSLGESPVWLYVPLKKEEGPWSVRDSETGELIFMNPYDPLRVTWRILASSQIGSNKHIIDLYFAANLTLTQLLYSDTEAFGKYHGPIIIDLYNN